MAADLSAEVEGSVLEVVLENFKSYGGKVKIGPLGKFTCVVGPNGAGKSNLVDAIAFVLCAGRRRDLSVLVHREEADDRPPSALGRLTAIELVYARRASIEAGAEEVITFRRALSADAQSCLFCVNDTELSEAEYVARLETINILSNARNFLVFQGDVEAAAQRRGKDLARFFEVISGSAGLQKEYERLAKEQAKLEDDARHLFHRKRSALNEKKFLTEQKVEAERFLKLETNYRKLQVEFYLFRLQGLEQQAQAAERERAEAEEQRAALALPTDEGRERLAAAERARERAHLAAAHASREAANERARFEQLGPELAAARSRLTAAKQRLEDLREQADRERRRQERLQEQLNKLERDRETLRRDLAEQEEKIRAHMPFTEEQRAEFEAAQAEARRATASSGEQAKDLEAQLRVISRERARAEQEFREATILSDHLGRRAAELREARNEARTNFERTERSAGEFARRAQSLDETLLRAEKERTSVRERRDALFRGIQDITAAEQQIQHEQRLAKVTADLTRVVPGVRGRVLENCQPREARFAMAVNVVLAGYMDAIVTDTAEAARECVRYLKEHMLRPMLFLPMDSLRVPPEDRQLSEIVSGDSEASLHLAIACIDFDPALRDVFRFMLGDVIFTRDLATATRVAFGEVRRRGTACRFVTLDGETISRDGNIAVSAEASRGSTRFDFASLSAQRDELEAVDRRLRELHAAEAAGSADRARLRDEAQAAEARKHEDMNRVHRCQADLDAREAELQQAQVALAAKREEFERLSKDEGTSLRELRGLEEEIASATRIHFQQLSAAMGVEDVQKLERDFRKSREVAQARRREVTQQLGSLDAEMAMVRQTRQESISQDSAGATAAVEGELVELGAAVDKLAGETGGRQAASENAKRMAGLGLDAEHAAEKELISCRVAFRDATQNLAAAEKTAAAKAAALQALEEAKTDLLRQSLLEDVEVPLLPVVEGAQASVDFSRLPEEKRAAATGPAARLLDEEYRSLLRGAGQELERARPNLKARDQLSEVSSLAKDAGQDAAAAHREIDEVKRQFLAVREERRVLFMTCFNKVEKEINLVYGALTLRAGADGVGGSCFLDLEDLDEPYNGGIRFSVMPPQKRITDIGLLSGGERALAALALLFAVQAFQRPPILILDEVDAHLDAASVAALAAFVSARSLQTLVVSLRGAFCAKSEALVGISKDPEKEASIALTVDLGQFRTPAALPPTSLV